ncbi:LANO_0C01882g1_1 [Lachancea nothofagi CBS 11611]|uniref:Pre-mRNA-processing protein 45 n=1 Tax=Lachancea nothofagi CBS 11611 TaxID=1266666 RepID=A0A1G4J535_9SACH|nr:LANO_0C01882g1_1 [Lachancea nothofagi CBS 11611]
MSFANSLSSLLPRPKHDMPHVELLRQTNDVQDVVDAIAKSENVGYDVADFGSEGTKRETVTLENFLPLRHKYPDLELPLPTGIEIRESYQRTKAVFDQIMNEKLRPQGTNANPPPGHPSGVKTIQYNSSGLPGDSKTRAIQIVDQQVDPLQPKLFKIKKMVAPPADEPFAPVLHKSDDKTPQPTKEERDQWNIPSAISNWKNPNGYAIELDKRVASDGRFGKDSVAPREISDGFTKLSEALDVAEKKARQEVKLRGEAKRMLAEQDARDKEEKLRLLALKAREERKRYVGSSSEASVELGALRKRESEKKDRRIQLEKDLRQSKLNTADRLRALAAKQNREISDKVILGAAKASDTSGIQYDSRLFSKAANANSRRSDEQVYENPLFIQEGINTMYRPNFSQMSEVQRAEDTEKAVGIQLLGSTGEKRSREGPVEFTEADNGQQKADDSQSNPPKKHHTS